MLRIGAVSYLNTRPLIYGLRDELEGFGELSLNLPSRLADDLRMGRLDVGLIPSFEYFNLQGQGYQIVSDAVIACHGPVWSVRLMSRVPVAKIRTLAVDEGSRTSVALTKVLLASHFSLRPQVVPLPIEQDPEAVQTDAVLVIGDRAMHPPVAMYEEIWDLGERWCDWTGLPFVFAMWVARPGIEPSDKLQAALSRSRDAGMNHIERISQAEAGPHGLTIADLKRYFEQNLHFRLGSRELSGLQTFHRHAHRQGLLAGNSSPVIDIKPLTVNSNFTS